MAKIKGNALNQGDLVNLLRAIMDRVYGTAAFNGAGLIVGTAVAKIKTGGAIQYSIDGVLKTKASTDDFWTLTGTALTTTTARKYRLEIDAAGDASIVEGPTATVATGTLDGDIPVPRRSAGKATVGIFTVGGIAFTPGTTSTAADANRVYLNGDPDLNQNVLEA